eukprot:TRINITY_DN783_c0_g1_i1.p1 TRINITY_DN783_c0_g1~~TRINITY_DN783_c0_g1_i1.p1  ORF type:complete len:653 (+),score=201.59 TRINITY_DN783_c0_g1_i1:249-1961(+)
MMEFVGSTCALFFVALLAAFLAVVRLSKEGGSAASFGKIGAVGTVALAFVSVVVWAAGMAWELADLSLNPTTAPRLLGAGMIGAGVMSMIALAVMTAALLNSWKVRGLVALMHCCAVLLFEALSVLGFPADMLEFINRASYDGQDGLKVQVAGGAIATAALLMLMWTSVIVQCGTKMRTPQVCLCVLLVVGVIIAEGGRINQNVNLGMNPMDPTLAYMHFINVTAVILTVLTTCVGETEGTSGTEMSSSGVRHGVQQSEGSGLKRAGWCVGDVVLTGALLTSVAGTLLKSTATGYRNSSDSSFSGSPSDGSDSVSTSDMMASVGSTCALFFVALLAAFLAVMRLSKEGRTAALFSRIPAMVALALSFVSVAVWVAGVSWDLADLDATTYNTPIRLLGAGEICVGAMSMIALAVMTAALLNSWKVRGLVALMHCCAVLLFEALSVFGFPVAFIDVTGYNFTGIAGMRAQAAGGAIAAAALLMLMGTSAAVQCGTKMRTPQVCLCVLLAIGVIIAEGGRTNQSCISPSATLTVGPVNALYAYLHVVNAVAVTVTVFTTCSGSEPRSQYAEIH